MGITPIYSIPFADPTDLVRDWPALSEDVAEAVEDAVAGVPVLAGIGSNVVQAVKTDVFSTSSTSFTIVTGLAATITPTTATSKVLVLANVAYGHTDTGLAFAFRLAGGNADDYVGDADGNRTRAVFGNENIGAAYNRADLGTFSASMIFLDSPDTTSPVTYSVECRRLGGTGTLFVNRSSFDANNGANTRGASSIIVVEVAA